jgi:hypothetical protein
MLHHTISRPDRAIPQWHKHNRSDEDLVARLGADRSLKDSLTQTTNQLGGGILKRMPAQTESPPKRDRGSPKRTLLATPVITNTGGGKRKRCLPQRPNSTHYDDPPVNAGGGSEVDDILRVPMSTPGGSLIDQSIPNPLPTGEDDILHIAIDESQSAHEGVDLSSIESIDQLAKPPRAESLEIDQLESFPSSEMILLEIANSKLCSLMFSDTDELIRQL